MHFFIQQQPAILINFDEVGAKRNLLSPCQFKNKIMFEILKEIKKLEFDIDN